MLFKSSLPITSIFAREFFPQRTGECRTRPKRPQTTTRRPAIAEGAVCQTAQANPRHTREHDPDTRAAKKGVQDVRPPSREQTRHGQAQRHSTRGGRSRGRDFSTRLWSGARQREKRSLPVNEEQAGRMPVGFLWRHDWPFPAAPLHPPSPPLIKSVQTTAQWLPERPSAFVAQQCPGCLWGYS